jgi:hypothetical protein
MTDTQKKNKRPTKYLDMAGALKVAAQMGPNPNEHELHINPSVGCVHHETQLNDAMSGKAHDTVTKTPILPSSAIICTTDELTKKQSFCLYVEIYGNWPRGRKPGEDPVGDDVRAFLTSQWEAYTHAMDTPDFSALKKKLFIKTKQGDAVKVPCGERVKDPVQWPIFGDDHERAGEVDDSKSPFFIVKLWETELKNGQEPSPDDLVVNGGRQKVFTKIYDRTENFNAPVIKDEKALSNVVYYKGSYKQGARQFRLNVQLSLMNGTVYYAVEKRGDIQLKASIINVTKKTIVENNYDMTEADVQDLMLQAMAAEEYYRKAQPDGIEHADGDTEEGKDKRAVESDHSAGPAPKKTKK